MIYGYNFIKMKKFLHPVCTKISPVAFYQINSMETHLPIEHQLNCRLTYGYLHGAYSFKEDESVAPGMFLK